MEETDTQLLALYRDGDVQALERLVLKYRRTLFGFILGMLTRQEDAEEVFQEVWLKAIRHMDRYQDRNFIGWLMQIARNGVVDRLRRRHPDVSLDAESEEGQSIGQALASPRVGTFERVASNDLSGRIEAAVASLPALQREVFLLRMKMDVPFKEIARLQAVSINTALARMQYAMTKLRAALEADYRELGRNE